MSLEFFLPN